MPLTTFTKEAKVMIENTRDATHFDNRVFSGMIFFCFVVMFISGSLNLALVVDMFLSLYIYYHQIVYLLYLLMFHTWRREKRVSSQRFSSLFSYFFSSQKCITDTLLRQQKWDFLSTHTQIDARIACSVPVYLPNCKLPWIIEWIPRRSGNYLTLTIIIFQIQNG